VLTHDEIYQAFYDDKITKGFLHSHSYTGNPLACSAALATLAIFEADNILEENTQKSALIQAKMQVLASLPIEHMRHQGMIFAFDVQTSNTKFSRDCYVSALAEGLIIRPIGNTVYFMPPYTITEDEVDLMINATLNAVKSRL
jgi:adenosylmethionine-8-amino-7-oxononanoate aminotransferase